MAAHFEFDGLAIDALLAEAEAIAFLRDAVSGMVDDATRFDPVRIRKTHGYRVGAPSHIDGVAAVPLETVDPFWAVIEFGSPTSVPYAPMRKAVMASGARYEDGRA